MTTELRTNKDALARTISDPSSRKSIADAIADGAHLLPPADLELLSKALFDLLPSAAKPSPRPQGEILKLLSGIQRSNRSVPTYGGFFLPCLELLVRVPESTFREECRVALLKMLLSTETANAAAERRRFAATSLAGILTFQAFLQEYAQKL